MENMHSRNFLLTIALCALLALTGFLSFASPMKQSFGVTPQLKADPNFEEPSQSVEATCPSVSSAAEFVNSAAIFQSLESGNNYTFSNSGMQIQGQICRTILFFVNPDLGLIQVIVNQSTLSSPSLSIYNITHMAPLGFTFQVGLTNWAGYQAQYCTGNLLGVCYQEGNIGGVEQDWVPTESIGSPDHTNPTGCCAVSVWAGIGNKISANNNILIQVWFPFYKW